MKRSSILWICLLWSLKILAQQTAVLHGKVTAYPSGKSIEGALVSIRELNKQIQTGKDGSYQLSVVPYGTYEVEFFAEGKQKQTLQCW